MNIWYKFIQSAAEKGIGANATLRTLQAEGMAMRRQTFLDLYRKFAQVPIKADAIKNTRLDYRIGQQFYTEASGFMSQRYRYTVQVNIKDILGEARTMYTNVTSEVQLTRRQAETAGNDALYASLDRSDLEVESVYVHEAVYDASEGFED